MPASRFEKAAVLAERLKTWNHNDVAKIVRECLDQEIKNGLVYGLADSETGLSIDTKSYPFITHEFDNPAECFHSLISVGLEPPAEVMICMNKCIGEYFRAGGQKSLDNAFFGVEHVSSRSYARKNHDKSLDSRYALFDEITKLPSKWSLAHGAEVFLSTRYEDFTTDIDSFLKGYRRWKQNKII
jgi:hypothetical protein